LHHTVDPVIFWLPMSRPLACRLTCKADLSGDFIPTVTFFDGWTRVPSRDDNYPTHPYLGPRGCSDWKWAFSVTNKSSQTAASSYMMPMKGITVLGPSVDGSIFCSSSARPRPFYVEGRRALGASRLIKGPMAKRAKPHVEGVDKNAAMRKPLSCSRRTIRGS
jgi:hypothetical protein